MNINRGWYIKDCRPECPWIEYYRIGKVMKKTVEVISNYVEFDHGGKGSNWQNLRYPLALLKQMLDGFRYEQLSETNTHGFEKE